MLGRLLEAPDLLLASGGTRTSFEVAAPGRRFVIELRGNARVATVLAALERVRERTVREDRTLSIPVIGVPFMGSAGEERCAKAGVSWFDLSGNAEIRSRGLRVSVRGQANRFVEPGRPRSGFSPTASRIAHWLLVHPEGVRNQTSLGQAVGVQQGYVSRVVRRLEEDGLLERSEAGRIVVPDRARLFAAWREVYDFRAHRVVRAHVPNRSAEERVGLLSEALTQEGVRFAWTGLSAAWVYAPYANHHIVSLYVERLPQSDHLDLDEPLAARNTWLVVPNDPELPFVGVEWHPYGKTPPVPVVSPVLACLDLSFHPERAADAREELELIALPWISRR